MIMNDTPGHFLPFLTTQSESLPSSSVKCLCLSTVTSFECSVRRPRCRKNQFGDQTASNAFQREPNNSSFQQTLRPLNHPLEGPLDRRWLPKMGRRHRASGPSNAIYGHQRPSNGAGVETPVRVFATGVERQALKVSVQWSSCL
jgi:hypothetical protein